MVRPTRPPDPSALEIAIYNFELKAYKYRQSLGKNPSGKDLKKLQGDLKHLEFESEKISKMAGLQTELEQYRADNLKKNQSQLKKEPHHPLKTLRRHLYAIGEPQPTEKHSPHHIILGKGRTYHSINARLRMHIYGIGINDPRNGVWLPRSTAYAGHFTTPKAPPHSRIHGHNYEAWIGQLALIKNNQDLFVKRLKNVKMKIKNGTHPPEIIEKKDPSWKPKL